MNKFKSSKAGTNIEYVMKALGKNIKIQNMGILTPISMN